MKIVLIETLDLEVVKLPFPVSFAWTKKRGVNANHWFTPTGTCKMYIGHFHNIQLGEMTKEIYDSIMDEMKKAKCDILTDGRDYYTTGNQNITKINNMSSILYSAILEWNQRKISEGWGNLKENEEFILGF